MSVSNPRAKSPTRSTERVLLISDSSDTSYRIREGLITLGWSQMSVARSHGAGLKRITAERFSIVLFSGRDTDMRSPEFVAAARKADASPLLIALSENPQVEDAFNILRSGARGILRLPFTLNGLESVIEEAKHGPPLGDWVFSAPDRNAALAECVLTALYDLTVAIRQARQSDGAPRDLAVLRHRLGQSMELARLFAEHGADKSLFDRICDGCMSRAEMAASRLGRTRIALKKRRDG